MSGTNSAGPGAIRVLPGQIELNEDRNRLTLHFENTADRPIQVGSHIHLPDVNPGLKFERDRAVGYRLDIPAGTSIRFEPGVSKALVVVELSGKKHAPGISLKAEYPQLNETAEEA